MKIWIAPFLLTLLLTASLQIRLSHDTKKGYSYTISGPEIDEIIEADKKMKQYLKIQAPKKNAGPAPSTPAPRPAPLKK